MTCSGGLNHDRPDAGHQLPERRSVAPIPTSNQYSCVLPDRPAAPARRSPALAHRTKSFNDRVRRSCIYDRRPRFDVSAGAPATVTSARPVLHASRGATSVAPPPHPGAQNEIVQRLGVTPGLAYMTGDTPIAALSVAVSSAWIAPAPTTAVVGAARGDPGEGEAGSAGKAVSRRAHRNACG
jgi:hypothetical protein